MAVYGVALAELTHPVIEAFCQRYPNVSIRVYDADFHRGRTLYCPANTTSPWRVSTPTWQS